MGKRKFQLEISCTAIIELDDQVINAVDQEWRNFFYDLETPEEIADMIGSCMIIRKWNLHHMDGFANQPDSNAKIISGPDWDTVDVTEIKQ